jgi:hypothetical protein
MATPGSYQHFRDKYPSESVVYQSLPNRWKQEYNKKQKIEGERSLDGIGTFITANPFIVNDLPSLWLDDASYANGLSDSLKRDIADVKLARRGGNVQIQLT